MVDAVRVVDLGGLQDGRETGSRAKARRGHGSAGAKGRRPSHLVAYLELARREENLPRRVADEGLVALGDGDHHLRLRVPIGASDRAAVGVAGERVNLLIAAASPVMLVNVLRRSDLAPSGLLASALASVVLKEFRDVDDGRNCGSSCRQGCAGGMNRHSAATVTTARSAHDIQKACVRAAPVVPWRAVTASAPFSPTSPPPMPLVSPARPLPPRRGSCRSTCLAPSGRRRACCHPPWARLGCGRKPLRTPRPRRHPRTSASTADPLAASPCDRSPTPTRSPSPTGLHDASVSLPGLQEHLTGPARAHRDSRAWWCARRRPGAHRPGRVAGP